jgi:hypothetical protein
MPEDKRPKPAIDMTAERVPQPDSRPALAGSKTAPAAVQGPAANARRSGPGFFGYLLAGLIGAVATAGGAYLALTLDIPGFSLTDPHTRQRIAELEQRADSLEHLLRAQSRPEPVSTYQAASPGEGVGLNEVRSRLDGIVDAARSLDQTVQTLSERMQVLEQQPGGGQTKDAVKAEIASQTAPLQQRLASAEREIEALTRAQSERQADARTASLTLALTNLKRAISDGRPFPAELAAVETLSAVKLPISQLEAYKNEGVASLAEIQAEFADASRKTIESHYANKSNTFMGEVLSRAKSAIQVRPSGSSGDTVEAILGRMNASLKSGDIKSALLQGASLQSPPQEMMDWFAKAQARVTADEAVRKTDQELLASLTKAPARRQ